MVPAGNLVVLPFTEILLLRTSRGEVQIALLVVPLQTDHVLVSEKPQPLLWLIPELQKFELTAIVSRNVPPESADAQEEGTGLPFPHVFADRLEKLSCIENADVTALLLLSTTCICI